MKLTTVLIALLLGLAILGCGRQVDWDCAVVCALDSCDGTTSPMSVCLKDNMTPCSNSCTTAVNGCSRR